MNKQLFCSLTSLLLVLLCSCTGYEQQAVITDAGIVLYNTADAPDANNYTTYINKELNLTLNVLRTHITMGDNILKEKAIPADELASLASDIDLVQEAIESVEKMNPPLDYEDDRVAILGKLSNALFSLEEYRDLLASGDTGSLRDIIDLMESDYTALSSSFNLMWE